MCKLEYFSFGSNYDFLSVYEQIDYEDQAPSTSKKNTQHPEMVSLTETQLLHTNLKLTNKLISLKSLILGNLVHIIGNMSIEITREKFPNLYQFRVGSSWNDTIDLNETDSYQLPIFPTIHELQLPDCCTNEKFIQKLYRMFPNVHKIWFNLPNVKCLKRFMFTMHRSKLRELYLQTQFDFPMVLESAFISKPFDYCEELRKDSGSCSSGNNKNSASCSSSGQTLEDLEKLKNPNNCNQIYDDFIHQHNLSLPLTKDEMEKYGNYGIGSLCKLQVLEFHHVPRLLKIPTSNTILFTSPNATFHSKRRIGFMKYSLAEKLFVEEFPKLKNLKRLKFLGENFGVR